MPWKVYKDGDRFCVHKLNADDSKGERVACHDSEKEADDHLKALYVNVNEIRGQFTDIMAVCELRGSYPNVPIAADVDYAALIAGDDKPVFITIPIGKAGVTSGNKRHYDEAFLRELERQTLTQKPIGLMGHLSQAERATAFPAEAVHWVGAVRDGDTLWGKGYLPPGAVRDRIARYRASGRSLATSIDAVAEQVWDESLKAYRVNAATLRLGQIDLAPADRAGIPDLAEIPMLTSELVSPAGALGAQTAGAPSGIPGGGNMEQPADIQETPEMGKLEVINELTADDARLLPKSVREAIEASVTMPPEVAVVQELRSALGVDEKADLTKVVTELRAKVETARKTAVAAHIRELVEDKEKGVKVEAVRGLVTELVNARNPQSEQEADAAYTAVRELQSVKDTLAAALQATMGPRQRAAVQPQNGGKQYFTYPDSGKEV